MHRRLGLLLAFLVGALVAAQARVNGELGDRLGDGVLAALISFGVGLVLLCIALAVSAEPRSRFRAVREAVRGGSLPRWQLLGGLCGAALVSCQGLTVATIGVATFTVAVVGGQLLGSLWVDRTGLAPSGATPVTALRALGAAVALAAVAVAGFGQWNAEGGSLWLAVLPAMAGGGLAFQQAVNGRVGVSGGPIVAAWVNFAVGTSALVLVAGVVVAVRGWPDSWPTDVWLYFGGALGVVLIALGVLAVRWIGVLLLGLASVGGQLAGALVLDVLTPTGAGLSLPAVLACALIGVAVVLATR
ncbi:DMT family transporter [Aldersonia kunmingensis]|uniref:DMT family transporter n=1 Tax=Aldersonia kunmingensis TaxID=408066 RepID=UPI0008360B08|nr:DMT family transporter [Aldersonia kunmingensis]